MGAVLGKDGAGTRGVGNVPVQHGSCSGTFKARDVWLPDAAGAESSYRSQRCRAVCVERKVAQAENRRLGDEQREMNRLLGGGWGSPGTDGEMAHVCAGSFPAGTNPSGSGNEVGGTRPSAVLGASRCPGYPRGLGGSGEWMGG